MAGKDAGVAERLERGVDVQQARGTDRQVRTIVEATLADIEAHGRYAVPIMSVMFDNRDPASFHLAERKSVRN